MSLASTRQIALAGLASSIVAITTATDGFIANEIPPPPSPESQGGGGHRPRRRHQPLPPFPIEDQDQFNDPWPWGGWPLQGPDAPIDISGDHHPEEIDNLHAAIERLRRLVALSGSSNPHEAQAAATQAAKMLREKGLVDTLVAHMKTGWRPNGPAETAIVTMLLDDPRIAAQMTGPKKTASIKVRKARHLARTTSSSARPATDTTAIATGAIGAALGGVIGGPAGAIVGGLLGILIGAMTQQAKPKPRL